MVFNSLTFAVFFVIVYSVYLGLQGHLKLQNRWILLTSCIFYGWWDWRFLGLMFFTIGVDYFIANAIARTQVLRRRKILLALSILSNLSILGFFKYFNFFMSNVDRVLDIFGLSAHGPFLHIILPVGISFYTFQAMSYVMDVYRKDLEPARNILDYAAFITYFPQLVAGPIERGSHLLPQMLKPRVIRVRAFYQGGYLIFWGLFKKMFVADNLAKITDPVFASAAPYDGVSVLIALYAFAFQIYCDFSGYSDMAIGLGKCMGFDIMTNFNLPYFSTNPAEFWKRWHISLSTWLRDYLYIPLGGSRQGNLTTYRNLFLTMLLGGLWHGAQWTFVLWGAYHGLLLIAHRFMSSFFKSAAPASRGALEGLVLGVKIIFFFHLVCFGWLFFRAQSFTQVMQMTQALFSWGPSFWSGAGLPAAQAFMFFAGPLLAVEFLQYFKKDLFILYRSPRWVRWSFYYALLFGILSFGGIFNNAQFIYFQF